MGNRWTVLALVVVARTAMGFQFRALQRRWPAVGAA